MQIYKNRLVFEFKSHEKSSCTAPTSYINYYLILFPIPLLVYTRDIGRMANYMAEGDIQTVEINYG